MSAPLVLGAVLAGGRSSRFGSDKAQAVLGDRTLLARASALLSPWTAEVVAVGGPLRDGLLSVPDRPGPDLGPLGGVAGALAHARDLDFAAVLTISCDTPVVPDGLFDALVRRSPSFCEDAPTLGYWPVGLVDALLERLKAGGDRSVRAWARSVGAIPVPAGGQVANVNTPADLALLDDRERSRV